VTETGGKVYRLMTEVAMCGVQNELAPLRCNGGHPDPWRKHPMSSGIIEGDVVCGDGVRYSGRYSGVRTWSGR